MGRASYPGTLTGTQRSAVHVLCVHAAWFMGHPSMGLPRGMEALELDTFSCWTPQETLRLLARLAEISVSRALLPLWPLTTGSESEPATAAACDTCGTNTGRYRSVQARSNGERPRPPLCPPSQNHAPPTAAPYSGPGCSPPRYQVIDNSALAVTIQSRRRYLHVPRQLEVRYAVIGGQPSAHQSCHPQGPLEQQRPFSPSSFFYLHSSAHKQNSNKYKLKQHFSLFLFDEPTLL